jgi:AcrR family transcriptional regulator
MARTLDPAAHAQRRTAFVDAGLRLITGKGYEGMSVQDVLNELNSSRGAFYHYFDSKTALLDAVVERMVDVVLERVEPVLADPRLPALQKLQRLFTGIADWKMERKELLREFMSGWLADENAIVRERFRRHTQLRLTPLLAEILRQGLAEGTFSVGSADQAAAVFVSLVLACNEAASRLAVDRRSLDEVAAAFTAYGEAFERILGIVSGSWPPPDAAILNYWFA